MAKIKLQVSATIEETFKDFLISRKTNGILYRHTRNRKAVMNK